MAKPADGSASGKAKPTEYWANEPATQSCSWMDTYGFGRESKAVLADGGKGDMSGPSKAIESKPLESAPGASSAPGGARSFSRFGEKTDNKSVEAAIDNMRKLGIALPARYSDIGGADTALSQLRESVEVPLKHSKLFTALGVSPPVGILLYGPSGSGKSMLARAVATETKAHFCKINGPELVSDLLGESETQLRSVFEEAKAKARSGGGAIIFIDQIEAIAAKRGGGGMDGSMEARMVTTLLTLIDDVHKGWQYKDQKGNKKPIKVCVLAACTDPDLVDGSLRRARRFDREICVRCPDAAGRLDMLRVMTRDVALGPDVNLEVGCCPRPAVARPSPVCCCCCRRRRCRCGCCCCSCRSRPLTSGVLQAIGDRAQGYVGADLAALVRRAGLASVRDTVSIEAPQNDNGTEVDPEKLATAMSSANESLAAAAAIGEPHKPEEGGPAVCQRHLWSALEGQGRPTALKNGDSTAGAGAPTAPGGLSWAGIGGMNEQRRDVEELVSFPIVHHEKFVQLGVKPPRGLLLYGPPGCGKTLLARTVAAECKCNFICAHGPDIFSPYVGQSEAMVRQLFASARAAAPCILFFDEIDAVAGARGGMGGEKGGGAAAERVLNQLLVETDGMDSGAGGSGPGSVVILIGATSRPEVMDPALMRPGRLDQLLYIPLPAEVTDRAEILVACARTAPLGPDVDFTAVAEQTDGFSGADLHGLFQAAAELALIDCMERTAECAGDESAEASVDKVDDGADLIMQKHFTAALELPACRPSVLPAQRERFDNLYNSMRGGDAMVERTDADYAADGEAVVPAAAASAVPAGRVAPVIDTEGILKARAATRQAEREAYEASEAAETARCEAIGERGETVAPMAIEAAPETAAAAGGGEMEELYDDDDDATTGGLPTDFQPADEVSRGESALLSATASMTATRLRELVEQSEAYKSAVEEALAAQVGGDGNYAEKMMAITDEVERVIAELAAEEERNAAEAAAAGGDDLLEDDDMLTD